MIAKIYKKMYIRNLPFRVIVSVCYQMRLNVVFSGLSDNKKKTIRLKRAESCCPLPFPSDGDRWFRAYWVISTVQIVLFLGFEYFNADYFSDLSILTRFISRI